ncbi:MAG: acetylxylan esterase [Kiritimatiellae bacterium]|nr:acetylxylan esterase [Kiritimatiellia bacterium]
MNQTETIKLPDPFLFENGSHVNTAEDWEQRRNEIYNIIVDIEYGGLPPTPSSTRYEELHTSRVGTMEGARFKSIRVVTGTDRQFSFFMSLLIPPGDGPFPVILTGDACWRYVNDEIVAEVLERGYILAQFNRVEIVPDIQNSDRTTGLYQIYTEGTYGALAAWAWGYHRCIDVLVDMDFVDISRIGVIGHSRGGKASLLAGATDKRIAITCANDSGSGGAGCYKLQGPESETLAAAIRAFPYWYGPKLKPFVGREEELPFDQHFLKALIAPRALLTTEALGDLWANPFGTRQTHLAAKKVYSFLNAEKQIGIWYREGGHNHGIADWRVFLDFMEWQLQGCKTECPFDDAQDDLS